MFYYNNKVVLLIFHESFNVQLNTILKFNQTNIKKKLYASQV
jgi:hypothetical protein